MLLCMLPENIPVLFPSEKDNCMHSQDYDKVMEELEVDEELKKDIKEEIRQSMKAFESVPEEKTDEKNLDALLERLMKDYHRRTGS